MFSSQNEFMATQACSVTFSISSIHFLPLNTCSKTLGVNTFPKTLTIELWDQLEYAAPEVGMSIIWQIKTITIRDPRIEGCVLWILMRCHVFQLTQALSQNPRHKPLSHELGQLENKTPHYTSWKKPLNH